MTRNRLDENDRILFHATSKTVTETDQDPFGDPGDGLSLLGVHTFRSAEAAAGFAETLAVVSGGTPRVIVLRVRGSSLPVESMSKDEMDRPITTNADMTQMGRRLLQGGTQHIEYKDAQGGLGVVVDRTAMSIQATLSPDGARMASDRIERLDDPTDARARFLAVDEVIREIWQAKRLAVAQDEEMAPSM